MGVAPKKFLVWPLVVYLPVSATAAGLLAIGMRLSAPPSGGREFFEVFWAYALRFPGDLNIVRWIAPGLGLLVLLFLSLAIRSARPIVSLFSIRIILLTLVALITIVVKIFSVVVPLAPSAGLPQRSFEAFAPLTAYLFLFMDVDLVLVFLATFLPAYRGLKGRLV